MISVPTWFFILLTVLAGITALSFVLVCILVIAYWITGLIQEKEEREEIKLYMENPDDNPEHIPSEHN